MPREQVVGMLPARLGTDSREPLPDAGILAPVGAQLIVEEKVAADRDVSDREPLADDVPASGQVRVEYLPGSPGAFAEFLHDRPVRGRTDPRSQGAKKTI